MCFRGGLEDLGWGETFSAASVSCCRRHVSEGIIRPRPQVAYRGAHWKNTWRDVRVLKISLDTRSDEFTKLLLHILVTKKVVDDIPDRMAAAS